MRNIIVTGAGSGLGLEFLKRFKQQHSNNIFAIDRHFTDSIKHAVDTIQSSSRTWWIEFDITDESGIKDLMDQLHATITQQPPNISISTNGSEDSNGSGRIDLVIHSAGIRGLVPSVTKMASDDVSKAETIEVMNKDTLMKTLEVNAVGTFLLIKHLLPLMRPALLPHQVSGAGAAAGSFAKFIIMGSRMGSIAANVSGGAYAYRASKAALNAIVTSFALDVKDVVFVTVHPGRVATALCDGVFEEGAMPVEEAVPSIMAMIDEFGLADSGRFVDRHGKKIDW